METPLILTFRLTEDLWRRFYDAHYAGDHSLKIRYAWGAACIIIGAFGLAGLFNRLIAVLLLLTGFYAVLSRQIFVMKSVAAARKHPYFGKEISVRIDREGVAVRSEDAAYRLSWCEFTGYRKVAPGFMLYLGKNFFFIPRAALSGEEEGRLQRLLDSVAWGKNTEGR